VAVGAAWGGGGAPVLAVIVEQGRTERRLAALHQELVVGRRHVQVLEACPNAPTPMARQAPGQTPPPLVRVPLAGFSGLIHATRKTAITSSAMPMRAPELAEI
jgi:hypothetical protein